MLAHGHPLAVKVHGVVMDRPFDDHPNQHAYVQDMTAALIALYLKFRFEATIPSVIQANGDLRA